MTRRTMKALVAAALVLAFAGAVIASTLTGGGGGTHTMPNGQQMQGGDMGR